MIKFTRIHASDEEYDKKQWYKTKQVLTTLSSVKHPNIVEVFEIGEIDITDSNYQQLLDMINWNEVDSKPEASYNQHNSPLSIPYVIMEYIEGHDMVEQHANSEQALELLTDLMSALSVFAKYNICHGDMNFQNVIYNTKTGRYVVIDFDYSEITNTSKYRADIDVVNENLPDVLLYPQDYDKQLLPDTGNLNSGGVVIAGYCNHALLTNGKRSLNHYIMILSTLLGSRPLVLSLEFDQTSRWQNGVELL